MIRLLPLCKTKKYWFIDELHWDVLSLKLSTKFNVRVFWCLWKLHDSCYKHECGYEYCIHLLVHRHFVYRHNRRICYNIISKHLNIRILCGNFFFFILPLYCASESNSHRIDMLRLVQLLRLQGRQRHGREAIHIIDVHGDDQRSEVEVARNLTEEQNDGALSRKKKDMPTRQQKNKHQITYLAYKVRWSRRNSLVSIHGWGRYSYLQSPHSSSSSRRPRLIIARLALSIASFAIGAANLSLAIFFQNLSPIWRNANNYYDLNRQHQTSASFYVRYSCGCIP